MPEPTGDTGNAEANRLIDRLMSSDPDFDDCKAAAALIRKLAAAPHAPVVSVAEAVTDEQADAAVAYIAARSLDRHTTRKLLERVWPMIRARGQGGA